MSLTPPVPFWNPTPLEKQQLLLRWLPSELIEELWKYYRAPPPPPIAFVPIIWDDFYNFEQTSYFISGGWDGSEEDVWWVPRRPGMKINQEISTAALMPGAPRWLYLAQHPSGLQPPEGYVFAMWLRNTFCSVVRCIYCQHLKLLAKDCLNLDCPLVRTPTAVFFHG
jgi:hypothetical protein